VEGAQVPVGEVIAFIADRTRCARSCARSSSEGRRSAEVPNPAGCPGVPARRSRGRPGTSDAVARRSPGNWRGPGRVKGAAPAAGFGGDWTCGQQSTPPTAWGLAGGLKPHRRWGTVTCCARRGGLAGWSEPHRGGGAGHGCPRRGGLVELTPSSSDRAAHAGERQTVPRFPHQRRRRHQPAAAARGAEEASCGDGRQSCPSQRSWSR